MKNNLKEIMKQKQISFNDMAKLTDVSVTTIQNWQKAELIKPKTQRKIAKALKVDVTVLFEG